MPPDGNTYLYPDTTTLKNKRGLRNPEALERAQDQRAAARYAIMSCLPRDRGRRKCGERFCKRGIWIPGC